MILFFFANLVAFEPPFELNCIEEDLKTSKDIIKTQPAITMTSKKRIDIEGTEEGGEPKRPRAGEEEKQEVDGAAALQPEGQPQQRGQSRNWLTFSGRRRPRVGDEFQVSSLPSPSDKKEGSTGGADEGKEEAK